MNKITHCKLKKSHRIKRLEFFVIEVTARSALFCKKVRQVIAYHLQQESNEMFEGCIELDERYFGGKRKGKRGLGAAGKVAVFGIPKRQGKVYTALVNNTRTKTLMPIISRKIKPDSIVYTDSYRSYNALDISRFQHERINHSTDFAKGENHIKGIENFFQETLQNPPIDSARMR